MSSAHYFTGKHVVFGRVIRGYDVVQKIASVPVDAKDRPLSPVIISNCGELELRQPGKLHPLIRFLLSLHNASASKPVKSPRSESKEDEGSNRRRSRRSRSRSRSRSPSRERERRHRKKSKREKASDDIAPVLDSTSKSPTEETEEEYDARLEREENERLEAERRKELARIKEKYEDEIRSKDGVRFKGARAHGCPYALIHALIFSLGRGRMKFVDPEISQRRQESR